MSGALIVTALLGDADFAWADRLRRAHYPPERNQVPAHLTLFHQLPSSLVAALRRRLADETRAPPPPARLAGLLSLGNGTAFRLESVALTAIRDRLADAFAAVLVPQDRAGWRPHLTIQNKVASHAARALRKNLESGFVPRPLAIAGLAIWRYDGGPWTALSRHPFRG